MAKGVEYISPVDVISGETTTGSWVTVDISAHIPANAVAAIFDVYNASAAEVDFGVRAVGSTDTALYSVEDVSHKMESVKLNANREYQFQQQTTGFEMWLVGYVPEGAGEFVADPIDVTPGSDGTWEDIDVGSLISDGTAGCAFFRLVGDPAAQDAFGLRMKGSTDTFTNDIRDDNSVGGIIGVNAAQLCEGFCTDVSEDQILFLGVVYEDYCTFNVNASDYSTGTTGSYVTTTLTEIPGSDSTGGGMAAFVFDSTIDGEFNGRLRRTGDTPAYGSGGDLTQFGFFVHGFNESKQTDQYLENSSYDLKLLGWFIEGFTSSSSSSSSRSSSSSSSSSQSSCVPTVIEDITVESSSSSSSSSSTSSSSSSSSSATPGTVTWGHHTGVTEDYSENFEGNTTGWEIIGTPGNDNEAIDATACNVICVFERWYLGSGEAEIVIDSYQTGSGPAPVIQFRTATTGAGLSALSWQNYVPPSFTCLGWVQIRLVHV